MPVWAVCLGREKGLTPPLANSFPTPRFILGLSSFAGSQPADLRQILEKLTQVNLLLHETG